MARTKTKEAPKITAKAIEEKLPEGQKRPEPYIYADLVEVPPAFKELRGGLLNLQDVNWIMQRAHDLGYWNLDTDDKPIHFIPHYGQAREEFVNSHDIENGVWIPKAKA